MEFVGNKSVGIICLTGLFTGLVFSFQAWLGLSIVNADNLVGPTAALGIARELGPVLTGLIIAARAGGAMAAQLGTMKVTEQIDALMVMGVDPQQYLVSPRIAAAVKSTPLMCAVFDFVAFIGTYILSIHVLGLDVGIFWEKIRDFVDPRDIGEGLLKSAIFGLVFSVICTYRGFHADGGAKGVGDATNRGVVASMVMIIVADYFITRLYRIFVKTVLL
jgi:phospholipid/cholesterol/gamma-HCH transport system permease protein